MRRVRSMPGSGPGAGGSARGLPIGLLLVALLLAIPFAGCLSGPDDSTPRGTLTFTVLRFTSPVAADSAATVDLGFYVGPNGCWRVDSLFVERSGNTIEITGTSYSAGEEGAVCPAILVYGERTISLPALEPGTYFLRACSLRDTLVVAEEADSSSRRVVMRGRLFGRDGACGVFWAPPSRASLSSLPDSLPSGDLLVRGEELASDPCELWAGHADFFVSVRHVAPAPT